jgi:hypothetical protein
MLRRAVPEVKNHIFRHFLVWPDCRKARYNNVTNQETARQAGSQS